MQTTKEPTTFAEKEIAEGDRVYFRNPLLWSVVEWIDLEAGVAWTLFAITPLEDGEPRFLRDDYPLGDLTRLEAPDEIA